MPDYFYGPQAEQFAFYRIPKVLFTDQAQRLKPVHQFVTEQPHPGLGYVDTSAYYLEILKDVVCISLTSIDL